MKKELFIIDDDLIDRMLALKTINKIDSTLIINQCENGESGLATLESIKNSNHQIIVLLDINMPSLSGWEVLNQIEKSNFYNLPKL